MKDYDLRIIKSKTNIHEKLLELLKIKPIAHIKVTELCMLANVSRGTFYAHYDQVGDVLQERFSYVMDDLERSYNNPYKKGFSLQQQNLDPDMILIFDHVKKHEEFYRIILAEESYMKYYYSFYETLVKILADPRYSNAIGDPYATAFSANGMIALIIEWYKNDFADSVEKMNERLFKVVLHNGKI